MMVQIPGYVPSQGVPQQPQRKGEGVNEANKHLAPQRTSVSSSPYQLDSQAIAVRMAALAHEAKEKELSFEEIIEKVISETGLDDIQAAMEEANRKIHKEIEEELEKIKANKELMEEAQSWQEIAELLENKMSQEQVTEFLSALETQIKSVK